MSLKAIGNIESETQESRITRWDFAPGAETGHHRHEYRYAIVYLTDASLRVIDTAGDRVVQLKAGESYMRSSGIEHNVINAGPNVVSLIEIEIKQ